MKKTWRKALRRLIKAENEISAKRWPNEVRRLPARELQVFVREAWAEVGPKLKSCPRQLFPGRNNVPAAQRRGAVWSMVLMQAIV